MNLKFPLSAFRLSLCLFALVAVTPSHAVTFNATNNLGSTLTLAFFNTNSAGQISAFGAATNISAGTSNVLTSTNTWSGVAVVSAGVGAARLNAFTRLANVNGANTSYLVTNGVLAYYNLAAGSTLSGAIAQAGAGNSPPSGATPQPVANYAGTNAPNGIYTAGYGSLYNQFDATGTNFIAQFVKTTTTSNTGWVNNTNFNATGTVVTNTPEQFGAKADIQTVLDMSSTNGSQIVYSPSANFTSADVGKIMVVYTTLWDTNYTYSIITNIVSAHQVQLSNACIATLNGGKARWYSDNVPAIQAFFNYLVLNKIPKGMLTNGCYGLGGQWTLFCTNSDAHNTNIYGLIQIGFPWMRDWVTTNLYQNLTVGGVSSQVERANGFFSANTAGQTGASFFCATPGVVGRNDHVFTFSGTNSSGNPLFSVLNSTINNVACYAPQCPTFGWFDNTYGGTILIEDSEIGVDQLDWNHSIQKDQETNQPPGVEAITLGRMSNNGNQCVKHCEIYGYTKGIDSREWGFIDGSTVIHRCQTGLMVSQGLPTYSQHTIFDVCLTNICLNTGGILNGVVMFAFDDTNTNHNCIFSTNPGWVMDDDLLVIVEQQVGANLVLGTNAWQIPPQGSHIHCSVLNATYATLLANPLCGDIQTMSKFPYGVIAASQNNGAMDWTHPVIFGGSVNTAIQGFAADSQWNQLFITLGNDDLYVSGNAGIVSQLSESTGKYMAKSFGIYGGGSGSTTVQVVVTNTVGPHGYTNFYSGGIMTNSAPY